VAMQERLFDDSAPQPISPPATRPGRPTTLKVGSTGDQVTACRTG
jgi:hypothetical protein